MTKTPTAVFKCRAPELVEAYEASSTELFDEYRAKVKALQEEWGVGPQMSVRSGWDNDQRVTGYVPEDRNEEPKPGFRKDRDTGFMVPAKRTAEGKAIAQRLKDVHYKPGKKPGLPNTVMGEGYMGPMVLRQLNGTWYAYCTVPLRVGDARNPHMDSLSEVDVQLWEPVKLSEYFLDLETHEAANPTPQENTNA